MDLREACASAFNLSKLSSSAATRRAARSSASCKAPMAADALAANALAASAAAVIPRPSADDAAAEAEGAGAATAGGAKSSFRRGAGASIVGALANAGGRRIAGLGAALRSGIEAGVMLLRCGLGAVSASGDLADLVTEGALRVPPRAGRDAERLAGWGKALAFADDKGRKPSSAATSALLVTNGGSTNKTKRRVTRVGQPKATATVTTGSSMTVFVDTRTVNCEAPATPSLEILTDACANLLSPE